MTQLYFTNNNTNILLKFLDFKFSGRCGAFKINHFNYAEKLNPKWKNPQMICEQMGASVKGGLGPFGLLASASKDLNEYTTIFFRIFRTHHEKMVVLMCSDQSR